MKGLFLSLILTVCTVSGANKHEITFLVPSGSELQQLLSSKIMVKCLHLSFSAKQKTVVAGEIWAMLSCAQIGQGGNAGAFL